ncbi:non-ribosomal peptide synthetase [Actinosynnema mirum]|uniref:Amino acid adenylation domain protein n=1 Tax=Actinosynnema mirum (strain ATCC 29888 / DSM 43827 / JCM 3225 / NBRC 14064 / NCIMB 13271 / NRRL B-12336 / IMRU 3971 / 101) TaxID=446462 RepID=C6WLD7_ACTMD|nr:non-ribosomal peptide synthetase [Actinosynnema mirum]ACU38330.1 amino acid adenylation domain protein [Actinosynnema mirum DSM 43827]
MVDSAAQARRELLRLMLSAAPEPPAPTRPAGGLPTSAAQRRLWFLDQLNGPNSAYNVPFALRLRGPLVPDALWGALDDLVARHEVLRTDLVADEDDEVRQEVRPPAPLPRAVETVAGEDVEARIAREAARPFRLDGEPLLRALLLRVADDEHHLVLNLHHVVTDGWSETVLFRELGVLYSARALGRAADLPPAAQYADYAVWEAGQAGGPVFEAQLAHWRDRLSGHLGEAGIPTDRPRPLRASTLGANVPVPAPADLRARLRSSLGGASLFTGVLTALAVLLHRYGGRDRVVVGVPVINRTREDWESALGFFANTVALRLDLSDNPSLGAVADRVTAETLDALSHQHVPFDRVVDALDAHREAGMNPVFQVMCSVNEVTAPPELVGLEPTLRSLDNDTAKFDVEFAVEFSGDHVDCRFEYATDLFDRPTVEALARHYRLVLDALLADPSTRVGDLVLATEAEATAVLDGEPVVLRDRYGAPVPVGVPGRAGDRTARLRRDGVVELLAEPDSAGAHGSAALDGDGPDGGGPAAGVLAEPVTPTERALAAIWEEVLGLARVGRDQHFFRGGGGDSMLATKVVVRVRRLWSVRVTVRQMLQHPVLSDLAAHIDSLAPRALPQAPAVEPGPVADTPLSHAQQRLWFLEQLEPGGSAYTIAELLDVTGPLRADALERALNAVVARHDALRTTVAEVDGVPLQRVAPSVVVALPVVDHTSPERALREAWRQADRPFDLAAGPLVRATLHRVGPERHLLALSWHHLVFDGWSQDLFLRELGAFYARETGADVPVPPAPAVQYADYARWQRASLRDAELTRLHDYWSAALADAPTLLELPTDRPRPATRGTAGSSRDLLLDAELARGLRDVARHHGVTPYLVLFAAFNALLARHTGSEDLVVGGTTANRDTPEVEGVIGLFVNTLALRTDLSGNPAFGELTARVRDTVTGAYAHQELPFEQVVELLRVERSPSRTPLFQVLFDYQENSWSELELPGLEVRRARGEDSSAMFDLTLVVIAGPDGLHCDLQYATDLFDEGTALRLLARWEALLRSVVRTPDARLHELELLPPDERALVTGTWCSPRAVDRAPGLVPERVAAVPPDATALVRGARSMTYGELNDRAARLAARLAGLGVGRGDRVLVCAPRGFDYVVASLAAMRAGAAYLPLDAATPAARVAHVVARSTPKAVLVTPGTRGLVEHPAVLEIGADHGVPPAPIVPVGPGDAAYVIHTSGSTGTPKGVQLDHGGLAHRVDWYTADCGLTARDRVSQIAGTAFDVSVLEIWTALSAGARLHLADDDTTASGEHAVRWLAEHRVTVAFLPTPLCELALDLPWPEDSPLRVLTTGGAALRKRPRPDAPFTLLNLYGPAEATVVAVSAAITPDGPRVPPIGVPVPGARALVLDRHLNPVGVGVPGDLHLGGVGVANGYVGRPDLTADRFGPDPLGGGDRLYRTGDLARWLPDGTLEYLGRLDDQVQLRGFRVEPGEIAAVLLAHPDVADAVVVAREEPGVGTFLVAYVVPAAGPDGAGPDGAGPDGAGPDGAGAMPEAANALRAHLATQLPDYMVPTTTVFLPELPLNRSGKVDRAALPVPTRGGVDHVPPRDDLEAAVAGIWRELLRVDRVGVHDDFFALGGHSLLATKVVSRIRSELSVSLPVRQLFETGTVARLAAVLADARAEPGAGEPAVVRRERRLHRPPVNP